jgi:hypothetical protein
MNRMIGISVILLIGHGRASIKNSDDWIDWISLIV